uniref:Uncharacterized protein n=1 Tax=Salarias fasciatus TaxID=181472 RepID=A0A672GPJ1_SALFA
MHGESSYYIMFGPDICGYSTKKVHVIFNYKGKNHLIKKEIKCKDDELTHLYTLILNSDQTYEVKIDNEKVESGSLEDDWDFLRLREVEQPSCMVDHPGLEPVCLNVYSLQKACQIYGADYGPLRLRGIHQYAMLVSKSKM